MLASYHSQSMEAGRKDMPEINDKLETVESNHPVVKSPCRGNSFVKGVTPLEHKGYTCILPDVVTEKFT